MNTFTATVVLLLLYCFLVISAGREYQRIAKLRGDPVLMWCNTTKSGGVKWSQNTTIGRRFSYVYINGSVEGSYSVRRRFSVSEHSLKIYNAQRTDSGRYDCFDSGEVRRFGYELNVTAKPDRYYYRTVDVGQTVKFPCETKLPENVNWKRMDVRHEYIYRGGTITPYTDPRLTVDKNNSYTLTILNVTTKDSTLYGCFEDDGVGNKRYYGLTVTETPLEYTHVDELIGETVSLSCNTSADDVVWTYDTNDGYVDYIYWNQRTDNDKRRLSVNVTADDFHTLIISDVQFDDSGRYDCYDNNGLRVVGYQLALSAAVIEHKTETPVIDASIFGSIVGSISIILAVVIAVVNYWCIPKCRGGVNSLCKREYSTTPTDEPDNVPDQPRCPVVIELIGTSVTLEWTAPLSDVEISSYVISYGVPGTDVANYSEERYDGQTTSCTLTKLKPKTKYHFAVAAENESGRGPLSIFSECVVTDEQAATVPGRPTIDGVDDILSSRCTVIYLPPDNDGGAAVTGYFLERRSPGLEWIRFNDTPVTGLKHVVDNLAPLTEYQFRVAAINKFGGISSFSEASGMITTKAPSVSVPDQPRWPVVVKLIGTSVTLEWTAPSSDGEISSYVITYGVPGTDIATYSEPRYDGQTTSCTLTQLKPDTKYHFAVAAENEIGCGPLSIFSECVITHKQSDKSGAFTTRLKLVNSFKLESRECNWVCGVTQLGDIVYAVFTDSPVIKMFTADKLHRLGERIHVEGMRSPTDIVACHHDRQLYVGDKGGECIWRVSVSDGIGRHSYIKWLTEIGVFTLSLTSHHLFVTSSQLPHVRQYDTTDGQLVREVPLPSYVKLVWHAAETSPDTFVLCHKGTSDGKDQFAVSEVNVDGQVLATYNDVRGPRHLSIDSEGRVLVADKGNDRILLLSRQLKLVCVIIDKPRLWRPLRLSYNELTSRLYVAHCSRESSLCDVISLYNVD